MTSFNSKIIDSWLKTRNFYDFIDKVNKTKFLFPKTEETDNDLVTQNGPLKSAIYFSDEKTKLVAKKYIEKAYEKIQTFIDKNKKKVNLDNVNKILALRERLTFVALFLDTRFPRLNELDDLIFRINDAFLGKTLLLSDVNAYPQINQGCPEKIIDGELYLKNKLIVAQINKIAHQHFANDFEILKEIESTERKCLNYSLFLATDEKNIGGFVFSVFNDKKMFSIDFIALSNQFKRKNIGTKLILRAFKKAQDEEKEKVFLSYFSYDAIPYYNLDCEIRTKFYEHFSKYNIAIKQVKEDITKNDDGERSDVYTTLKFNLKHFDLDTALETLQQKNLSTSNPLSIHVAEEKKSCAS